MMLLCLGVVAGYVLVGLLTARAVFRRGRERFLRAGGARRVGAFERQERQQTEAFALCTGALWPVALPVLALHGLVGVVALDRGRPAPAVRPEPSEVAARIEELERDLRLGPHAVPPPRPVEGRARREGRRNREGWEAAGGVPCGASRPSEQRAGAARARRPRSV
ncbi:hypothetical protein [Kitasatospora sp. NPDC057198]|uniref:hypothetical protein n=1 Tax=Kitasatospora sp. NPDC057198 TaxID=3346046 RepID=UPI003637F651